MEAHQPFKARPMFVGEPFKAQVVSSRVEPQPFHLESTRRHQEAQEKFKREQEQAEAEAVLDPPFFLLAALNLPLYSLYLPLCLAVWFYRTPFGCSKPALCKTSPTCSVPCWAQHSAPRCIPSTYPRARHR